MTYPAPSTAAELGVLMAETERGLVPFRQALNQWARELLFQVTGRPVCARRARKLRHRGHEVLRTGCTSTGKGRYHWVPGPRITWSEAPRT